MELLLFEILTVFALPILNKMLLQAHFSFVEDVLVCVLYTGRFYCRKQNEGAEKHTQGSSY